MRGWNSLTCINFSEDVGDLFGSVSRLRSFVQKEMEWQKPLTEHEGPSKGSGGVEGALSGSQIRVV